MINTKDLMIGNYVEAYGEIHRVCEIYTAGADLFLVKSNPRLHTSEFIRDEHISPIKISREWLRKLGFWKYYKAIYRKGNHEFYVNQDKMRVGYELLPQKSERAYMGVARLQALVDVEYVHQLQNLVRVIANEELTIDSVGGEVCK